MQIARSKLSTNKPTSCARHVNRAKFPVMNRAKTLEKLKTLTWSELDWLEQEIRRAKQTAGGGKCFSSNGDGTHRAEAVREITEYFEDVLYKHHGI